MEETRSVSEGSSRWQGKWPVAATVSTTNSSAYNPLIFIKKAAKVQNEG